MFEQDLANLLSGKTDLERLISRVFKNPEDEARALAELRKMKAERAAHDSDAAVIRRALEDAARVLNAVIETDTLLRVLRARMCAKDCGEHERRELLEEVQRLSKGISDIMPAVDASVRVWANWIKLNQWYQAHTDAILDELTSVKLLAMQNPLFRALERSAEVYSDAYAVLKVLEKQSGALDDKIRHDVRSMNPVERAEFREKVVAKLGAKYARSVGLA